MDQVLILGAIKTGIEDHHDAANVGARNRNAKHRLDAALSGATAAFEMMIGGVVDKLLPRRVSRFINSARQATADVERKLLTVVAKRIQVELLVGKNRASRLAVVANHLVRGGVPRVAKAASCFGFLHAIARNKRRHPEVHVLKRHSVSLQVGRDLGEKGRRMQQTALLVGIQSGTQSAVARQHVQDFLFDVVAIGAFKGTKSASFRVRLFDKDTLLEVLGIRAERHAHHELTLGHASSVARYGAALVHLLAGSQVRIGCKTRIGWKIGV